MDWSLPLGWRVFELRQRLSGEWTCRVQQISHNIFLFGNRSLTPEEAFTKAKSKIKEIQ